ncbi:MAG: peptidyl-tRNA hydrolase [Candidatus Aenigmatarchaeota archaeon]|nr:MAG: peptidyl-tRNA hydrolase [Candidatus Aenigmarchaeota archaeon]
MYKQVILVRKDLKLSPGKLAVQVAHASLQAYKLASARIRKKWEEEGAKKVVLAVSDLRSLKRYLDKAKRAGIPSALIMDRGLTQLKPGTITCLGLGPAREEEIDRITGKLKLL